MLSSKMMHPERILLLQDDPEACATIRGLLAQAGYEVVTASSGAAAIAAASASPFDLLITDTALADMSGIDACHHLRALSLEIAALVIIPSRDWEAAGAAMRAGLNGFLAKPIVPKEMLATVAAALEQAEARRENARLRALVPLYELSRAFIGTSELPQVLNQIVTTARAETRAEVVSLMLIAEDGRELSIAAASGLSPEIVESQKVTVGSGIAGWVAAHGKPLIISEDVPLAPEVRRVVGRPEVLSALSLPLAIRDQVIGVLNLARLRGAEPFTRGDLELASVLAGQAAVSIDKARLIEDLRSLSETSQKLASAFDLDEAAGILVEATARVAHAPRAALWLAEDVSDQLMLYKTHHLEADELKQLRPPEIKMFGSGEMFNVHNGAGVLWLPITRADKKFGLIELHLPGAQPPRPDRLGVLRTLAHTAAAVIESYRLRAREVIAFRELDTALRSDLNLRQVLDRVLTQMIEACSARGGAIFLVGENDTRLGAWASSGLESPIAFAQQVVNENEPLLIPDLQSGDGSAVRSLIGMPLSTGSHVEGAVILTHPEPSAFSRRHLNLLSVLTSSTALIVRNAQLYARSEEAAIGEERTRIAREIHDGLAQDLAFLILKAEVMRKLLQRGDQEGLDKELEEMTAALRNDVREVRRTIFALRPLDLEALGFLPALEKFINDFGSAHDLKISFRRRGDASNLSPKLQTALFRLAQESLNNIRKHARATKVWIDLTLTKSWATLQVRDDGRGFDPAQALPEARVRCSVGMIQMRERAERAGGSFDLDTAPGQGTKIKVKLPIK